jgi:hypothetical protein
MARPQIYHWLAADTSAICALQSTVAASNLLINGTQRSEGMVVFPRNLRAVSISSANNLGGANFTITGFYGNKPVSETRTGPNGPTVYTTQLFTIVTSVSVDTAVNGVSVGSGNSGHTAWFNFNYHCVYPLVTAAISDVSGTVSLSGATTLDDVNTNFNPFLFEGIVLSSAIADSFGSCTIPISYATILVSATSGSFTATFLQQGIT